MIALHEIHEQILQLPGVVGALTCDARGTVLASSFPAAYGAQDLQRVARLLSEDFLVQQALAGTKGGLDLRYAGGRLLLRPFSRGAVLALCAATANAPLVNLGLVQAIHRLEKVELPGEIRDPELPAVSAGALKPAAAPLEALPPGVGEALKEAFLRRIGPIGDLIYTRYHAKWSADAVARTQGVRPFVALLAAEIDDPADQKSFVQDARIITG
ncbi:MAG TPA: hypothetical protein VJ623_05890 [Holophagaceae bacterium]|nr:hypothetical protein [Holophagaceae bacterium]